MSTRPSCAGLSGLFDDTTLDGHYKARQWCAECPMRTTCAPPIGLPADGTWGGNLYRDGNRVLVPKVDRRVLPEGPGQLVACPTCGARLAEGCKTRTGNPTTNHVARVTSRRCVCGSTLEPHHLYCSDACRQDARKATYARREQRVPTGHRRAC